MNKNKASNNIDGLTPHSKNYGHQKCFVGYSSEAEWHPDIESVCSEVLPKEFNLEPWYASDHPDPTKTLRNKVVEMIANARYGIYDISYWYQEGTQRWIMPRNVLIELGIAIALNRPILLLRHTDNEEADLELPQCLESMRERIISFGGKKTLKDALIKNVPQWMNKPPEHDWWNRYCTFGNRLCRYREIYPLATVRKEHRFCCYISDGHDKDRPDFRDVIEQILVRYDNIDFTYIDSISLCEGYTFLLCKHCQSVRSKSFAIYRITSKTPAETFISIGISLSIEKQFDCLIPTILVASCIQDIPSLLIDQEICIGQNNTDLKSSFNKFVNAVIDRMQKSVFKSKPLPFITFAPHPSLEGEDIREEGIKREELFDTGSRTQRLSHLTSTIEWLEAHYQSKAQERERMIHDLQMPKGSFVVDAGCGSGLWMPLLAKAIGPKGRILGVDISPEALITAQKRSTGKWYHRQVHYKQAELEKLPIQHGQADTIFSANVSQYLPDPALTFAAMGPYLKQGGRLVIKDIDFGTMRFYTIEPELQARVFQAREKWEQDRVEQGFAFEDSWVGSKLAAYLRAAGYVDVQEKSYLIRRHYPLSKEFRFYLQGIAEWFVCENAPYLLDTEVKHWLHCFLEGPTNVLDQETFVSEETEFVVSGIWHPTFTKSYYQFDLKQEKSLSG